MVSGSSCNSQLLSIFEQYICSLEGSLEGSLYFRRGRGSDNRRTIQARKVLCCFRPVGHLDGSSNIDCCVSIGTGEEQKKLDVLSNEVFVKALVSTGRTDTFQNLLLLRKVRPSYQRVKWHLFFLAFA
ncbi:putative fructose-bisphosphatase [Helianthus annuus]|uniref:Fructose-bisphosphatase n=1 Tax=Helianthus annuus TaxID=4232 RepID=A0A9K3EI07_HELAN|nr:putative fructose-bisphosphatase [Helianthus annuus]KAJ0477542.1 putative fructose-bisphosphatase [Helianthus annuus]KAJ0482037.1 putative fructose-bisphosphatase [Helianthus annuus]KAJ0498374.1 putative fructose-bisphosphatase [Helianthus annuus]KAJ0664384.1 putative fructose-bisphosphatase [Helianthus annuus]